MRSTFEVMPYLASDAETQALLVEMEAVTPEELTASRHAYNELVASVEAEWPPERVTHTLLLRERKLYRFYKKQHDAIERENSDARVRGVSYRERRPLLGQIDALGGLMKQSESIGSYLARAEKNKTYTVTARKLVKPSEAHFIHTRGFGEYLKYVTIEEMKAL